MKRVGETATIYLVALVILTLLGMTATAQLIAATAQWFGSA